MKINILYEDNHVLVIEKPVNIPSQKDESNDEDMLTLLKAMIKERDNKPGNVFLGLIHRLDRPAGGAMVFAKTSKAASRLSEQMRSNQFEKFYLAVVQGVIKNKHATLENFLFKNETTNTVHVVKGGESGAKLAILSYQVLETTNDMSLVRIHLQTGRPHQIRVQMANIGHPLFGDQKYGVSSSKPGQQLALWSTEIAFTHPTTHETVRQMCKPPQKAPWTVFQLLNNKDRQ